MWCVAAINRVDETLKLIFFLFTTKQFSTVAEASCHPSMTWSDFWCVYESTVRVIQNKFIQSLFPFPLIDFPFNWFPLPVIQEILPFSLWWQNFPCIKFVTLKQPFQICCKDLIGNYLNTYVDVTVKLVLHVLFLFLKFLNKQNFFPFSHNCVSSVTLSCLPQASSVQF